MIPLGKEHGSIMALEELLSRDHVRVLMNEYTECSRPKISSIRVLL